MTEPLVIKKSFFEGIVNKNEARVRRLLPQVLAEFEGYAPSIIDIQDIYALTLNTLPARYVQRYSFVIAEKVTDETIMEAIREAAARVHEHPKGQEG